MIANMGPADYNYDESLSTLRYANRAKNIKNKAKINEDPKDALLRQFQKEIDELRKQLGGEGMKLLIQKYIISKENSVNKQENMKVDQARNMKLAPKRMENQEKMERGAKKRENQQLKVSQKKKWQQFSNKSKKIRKN